MERRQCWYTQVILRELSSLIMQMFSFASVEKQVYYIKEREENDLIKQ